MPSPDAVIVLNPGGTPEVRLPVRPRVQRFLAKDNDPPPTALPGGRISRPGLVPVAITDLSGGLNLLSGELNEAPLRLRSSSLLSHIPGILCPPLKVTGQNFSGIDPTGAVAGNLRAHHIYNTANSQFYLFFKRSLLRTTSTSDPALSDSTYAPAADITGAMLGQNSSGVEMLVGLASGRSQWITGPTATPPTTANADTTIDALRGGVVWQSLAGGTRYNVAYSDSNGWQILNTTSLRGAAWAAMGGGGNDGLFVIGTGPDNNIWFVSPTQDDATGTTVPRQLRRLVFDQTATSLSLTRTDTLALPFSVRHGIVWDRAGIVVASSYNVVLVTAEDDPKLVNLAVLGEQGPVGHWTIEGLIDNWPELLIILQNSADDSLQVVRYMNGALSAMSEQYTVAGEVIPAAGDNLITANQRFYYIPNRNGTTLDVDRQYTVEGGLNPLTFAAAADFATGSARTLRAITANVTLPTGMSATLYQAHVVGHPDFPATANSTIEVDVSDDGGSTWDSLGSAITSTPATLTPSTPIQLARQFMVRITINHTSGTPASALPIELIMEFTPVASGSTEVRNPLLREYFRFVIDTDRLTGQYAWPNVRANLQTLRATTPSPSIQFGDDTIRVTLEDWELEEEIGAVGEKPRLLRGQITAVG